MPPLTIRPATSTDILKLAALDHGYSTEYVWQMDAREGDGQTSVTFRQVRLPRSMRVNFPRQPRDLADTWTHSAAFLVAEGEEQLKGYLALHPGPIAGTGWVADFAVDRKWRRQGAGTALFAQAVAVARDAGLRRLIVEMQSKNYPAIAFCQKRGLTFCGYNDRYYPNQDIALFFGLTLR
ncbi:MAG: GNAT family N-acetyltransferase [Chloroflexi bacterium]|nr:GNAT family N-acetyltransferase [Chloroflexota bacterium]MBI3762466.1 GNAT family N-acetyltransferase [Chloroflexota bacterium]